MRASRRPLTERLLINEQADSVTAHWLNSHSDKKVKCGQHLDVHLTSGNCFHHVAGFFQNLARSFLQALYKQSSPNKWWCPFQYLQCRCSVWSSLPEQCGIETSPAAKKKERQRPDENKLHAKLSGDSAKVINTHYLWLLLHLVIFA